MNANRFRWGIALVLSLSGVSAFLYYLQYRYAGGTEQVLQWLIGSLAFLPIQVLLLTLVVDRLLARREKLLVLKKLNMVIGVFFSELGTHLLERFAALDADLDAVRADLVPRPEWKARDFLRTAGRMKAREGRIEVRPADLLPPEMEKAGQEIGSLARSEEDVIAYALFPQVAKEFFERRAAGELVEKETVAAIAAALTAPGPEQT